MKPPYLLPFGKRPPISDPSSRPKKLSSFLMWQLRLVVVAMALVAIPSLALAYSITPSRPRLFFTAADVPALRQRIATTHAAQWQTLVDLEPAPCWRLRHQVGARCRSHPSLH